MRFHIDWVKALRVMLPFNGGAHRPRDAVRPARIRALRPLEKRPCAPRRNRRTTGLRKTRR